MIMDEEGDYTSACVSTALKRYTRRRHMKNAALTIMAGIAALVPWLFDFERSSSLIWWVGILMVLDHGWTEQRLRTMQIRLATMHDLLRRIAGDSREDQDELLMELVAEVGPVKPDPKFGKRQKAALSLLRMAAFAKTWRRL
jgi:hypothetical protein